MKKVCIVAAMAAIIVSCGSKGSKNTEMITESVTEPLAVVTENVSDNLETCQYEGVLPGADVSGINYQLTLQKVGGDSLGTYHLTTTYLGADNGQDQVFTDSGAVATIVGIPNDSTAIVFQLVSYASGNEKTNFLVEGDSTLTMVGADFEKAISELNYTLRKKL